MAADAGRVREGLVAFDARGAFSEDDYLALRRVLAGAVKVDGRLLDGFVGLFFERHVLDDTRRAELLALADAELLRALKVRFRQVVAGANDDHKAWHALSAHVREALEVLAGPGRSGWPATLEGRAGFSSVAVEQAVAAQWAESGTKPTASEATAELLRRYVQGAAAQDESVSRSREFPEVVRARLDAQRLARGILGVLTQEEKELLRHLIDGGAVDAWAKLNGVSRATAYRMVAHVKALCRLEFEERSKLTQLEVLDALRREL